MPTFSDRLPDLRRPGQPMASIPMKLPEMYAVALQDYADRLGVSRSAAARHLMVTTLDELVSDVV
jgi:predicted ArsR family transcriptional regulator